MHRALTATLITKYSIKYILTRVNSNEYHHNFEIKQKLETEF